MYNRDNNHSYGLWFKLHLKRWLRTVVVVVVALLLEDISKTHLNNALQVIIFPESWCL
jgi:undecaprenyl pyrophosphate phosphatase UppP